MRFSVPHGSQWSLACSHFESSQSACRGFFLPRAFQTRLNCLWSSSLLPSASRFKKPATLCSRPQDAVASGRLGMLLYAYQQNQSAAVCFERAHTLDPKEFRWTYYLATVQAALGDPVQAVSMFRESAGCCKPALGVAFTLMRPMLFWSHTTARSARYRKIARERSFGRLLKCRV